MGLPVLKQALITGVDSGGNPSALSITTASDTPADALLVAIMFAGYDGALATNPTTGTWVDRGSITAGTNTRHRIWTRFAGTAAAQTVAVNGGASSTYGTALVVLVLTNVDQANPWHVSSSTSSANNTYAIPAITTTVADCMEIAAYGAVKFGTGGVTNNITVPSGMTEDIDWGGDATAYLIAGVSHLGQASALTTPTRSVGVSDTGWTAVHFAVKGAVATTGQAAAIAGGGTLTAELIRHKPNAEATRSDLLTNFFSAISNRATTPVDILFIGDSITEGQGATTRPQRWAELLRDRLRAAYPTSGVTGGEGYVPAFQNITAPPQAWTTSGTVATTFDRGLGNHGRSLGASGVMGHTCYGTSVKIAFTKINTGGVFQLRVDGTVVSSKDTAFGATSTKDDTGTLSYTFTTRGSHLVEVVNASGTVYITGAWVYDQDETSGIRITEIGWSGAKASDWQTWVGQETAQFQALAPQLIVLMLGTNDYAGSVTAATYGTQMQSIVTQLRSALPNADILIMGPPLRNTYDYTAYLAQLQTIATKTPRCTMLDLGRWTLDGSVAGASIQTDSVHFSDEGHRLAAWAIFDSLTVGSTLIAQIDGTGTLTARTGQNIAATFAGAGAMTAADTQGQAASTSWGGAGSMTTAAAQTRADSASWAGAGAMSTTAALQQPVSTSWAGAGSLTATATQTRADAATWAGAGGMTAIAGGSISASWAGAGAMSAAAQQTAAAGATWAGAGALTAASYQTQVDSIAWAGSGALIASGVDTKPDSVTWAGAGSLVAAVLQTFADSTSFQGAGNLAATTGALIAATFAGAGSMSAVDTATYYDSTAFAGSGSMASPDTATYQGVATFAAAGALTALGIVSKIDAATWTGAGSMVTAVFQTYPGAATWAGVGALSISKVTQTDAVILSFGAAGAMTTAVLQKHTDSISWSGAGTLVVAPVRTTYDGATFAGSGALAGLGIVYKIDSATWAGAGDLSAAGVRTTYSGTTMAGSGLLNLFGATALPGQGLNAMVWAIIAGNYYPLPHFTKLTVSPVLNGVGQCVIDYPVYGKNFNLLTNVVNAAIDQEIEVWVSGNKNNRLRFLLQEVSGDDVSESAIWSFAGPSLEVVLDEALVFPQPITAPNNSADLIFSAANAGQILKVVIDQAKLRGCLSGYTYGFTSTVDSNGNSWGSTQVNIKFSPNTSVLEVAQKLVDLDMCDFEVTAGKAIKAYAPNRYGSDRTTNQLHPVTFRAAQNVTDAPRKFSLKDSGTVVSVAGGEGVYQAYIDVTATGRRGRRIERGVSAGQVTDVGAVAVIGQAQLQALTPGTLELTHGLAFTPGMPRPMADFDKGDYVWSATRPSGAEKVRVVQWSLTFDTNGASGTVTLNNLFTDRLVQLKRRIDQLSSGAVVVGTSTSSVDTGVPTPPTSLVVSSQAYLAGAVVKSNVSLSWTAPTTNVDGTAITDLQGYKVRYAYQSSPTSYIDAAQPGSGSTSCSFDALPGVQINIQVAAFDTNGNQSAWSSVLSHLTSKDATAPPTPSTPVVDNYLGTLRITWDQNTSSGTDMFTACPDFDYLEVHLSTSSTFTASQTTIIGQLHAKGTWVVTDLPYGTAQYARFKAIDTTGNASAQSATGTATPGQVVSADLFDGCVGTLKLADLAVKTAKIDNLAVNDAQMGNVSIGKLTAGTMSTSMLLSGIIRTAVSGNRSEIDSAGIRLYDTGGTLRVNFKTIDGSALVTGQYQSALSGMRIVINPGQTNPARIDFYSSGAQFASIEAVNVGGSGAIVLSGNNYTGGDGGVIMAYPSFARLLYGSKSAGNITSEVYTDGTTARINSPIVDIAIDSQHSAAGGNRVAFSVFDASRVNRTATQLNYWATLAFSGEPWLAAVNRDVGLVFTDASQSLPGGPWSSAIYAVDNSSSYHRDFRCAGLIYDSGTYSSSSRKIKRNIRAVADDGLDVRDALRHGRAHFFEKNHHDQPPAVNPETGEIINHGRKARTMLGLIAEDMPAVVQVDIANSLPDMTSIKGINMEAVTALTWHGLGEVYDQVEQLRAEVVRLKALVQNRG